MSSKVIPNKSPVLPQTPLKQSQDASGIATSPKPAASASGTLNAGDGFTRAAQGLLAHRASPLMSGAMRILGGDGVLFPSGLTDPKNPLNDAKYFRLLAAVVGLDELEHYFKTREETDQLDYIKRKEKRRQQRMAEKKQDQESTEEDELLDS